MKKKFIYTILCISVFASCNSDKNINKNESNSFPVTTVISVDTSIHTEYVTEIQAEQNVEIRARVTGYLEKIYVDEGAHVKENQLLFAINNREYSEEVSKAKAQYKSAAAEVEVAEIELSNTKKLAEKNIVSDTEVLLAKNKLESLKAKKEEAFAHQSYVQIKLSNTEVRAPFSGIINRVPHKIGSLIEEGTLLTTISENDEVFAYFDVSEKEYLSYAKNKDSADVSIVTLILADGSEHSQKGKIETIDGVIDHNTGNIAFRARFKNHNKIIKHGASGKIQLKKKIKNAVLIPQKATFEIQDKLYVYVVNENNIVETRNIKILYRLPHLFIVESGIKPGEKIIYEGIQLVKEGMKIVPEQIEMKKITKKLAAK